MSSISLRGAGCTLGELALVGFTRRLAWAFGGADGSFYAGGCR